MTTDVVVLGGGVVGLTIAYELLGRGRSVMVADAPPGPGAGPPASWAGAGILSPAAPFAAVPDNPLEQLRALSAARFPSLAAELGELTGLPIGLHRSGLVRWPAGEDVDPPPTVPCQRWTAADLHRAEPDAAPAEPDACLFFPTGGQVRNPWLVRALAAAVVRRGGSILQGDAMLSLDGTGGEAKAVVGAAAGPVAAGGVVLAAGAWSGNLWRRAAVAAGRTDGELVPVRPIRGQMLLLRTDRPVVRHVHEEGRRYLVPRPQRPGEHLVLVGSTEEETGFRAETTAASLDNLHAFAARLFPPLAGAERVGGWAGLRPASGLPSPLLGRVPGVGNLWVASGHFRQGVQLSSGTGLLLADWITGRPGSIGAAVFAPGADRTAHQPVFHS